MVRLPVVSDRSRGFYLVAGDRRLTAGFVEHLLVTLALRGPLRVLIGGNRFATDSLARSLRRRTPRLEAALGNIRLSRAFTCYQMLALAQATTTAQPTPIFVLDVLTTFYDESVSEDDSRRLFRACVQCLRRLSSAAPVVVTAQRQPRRDYLRQALEAAADGCWLLTPEAEAAPRQLTLF